MAETKEEKIEPQPPNQCRFCNAERDLNLNVFTSNGTTEYYKLINKHIPLNIEENDGFSPIVCYVCMFELTLYTELVRKYVKFRNGKVTTALMKQSCYFCGRGNINYDIPVDIRRAVKKIEHCISMKNKLTDGSPLYKKKVWFYYGKICHDCYFLVDTSYKLYEKAQASDKQLKEILEESCSDEEDIEESEGYGSSGECSSLDVGNIKKELKEEDEEDEEEIDGMDTDDIEDSMKTEELDGIKEESDEEEEDEEEEEGVLPGGIKIKDEPLIDAYEAGGEDRDPLDTGDFDPLSDGKKVKVKDEPLSEEEFPEDEEELYNKSVGKPKKRGGRQPKAAPASKKAAPQSDGTKKRGRGKKAQPQATVTKASLNEDDETDAAHNKKVKLTGNNVQETGENSEFDPLANLDPIIAPETAVDPLKPED